ncbi:MAG TPA: hypothetical protein VGK24_14485 [Candidatus Angelobacter sp.]|jgi:hypothetical protein
MREPDGPRFHWNEERLRGRFAALRREEEQLVPEFGSFWRGKVRVPRRQWRWLIAAACVLIVLLTIVWQRPAKHHAPANMAASIVDWKAPTDFLLETPGCELLRTVPEFGAWRAKKDVALSALQQVEK